MNIEKIKANAMNAKTRKSEQFISKWQCSHCNMEYTTDQLLKLPSVDDPGTGGVLSVCVCGKRFGLDKWQLKDVIHIGRHKWFGFLYPKLLVSTVHLELYHPGGMLYETIIFLVKGIFTLPFKCFYETRYDTKSKAVYNHKKIVDKLNQGEFNVTGFEIVINDS